MAAGLQTRMYAFDSIHQKRSGKSYLEISGGSLTDAASSSGGGAASPGTTGGPSSQVSTESNLDVWAEVSQMLTSLVGTADGRSVSVSPQSGMIVIRAMPDEHRKITDFLNLTQTSLNRQVIIEAKVLEVTLNDSYQHGINWGLLAGNKGRYGINMLGGGDAITGSGQDILAGTTDNIVTNGVSQGTINPTNFTALAADAFSSFGGIFNIAAYRGSFDGFIEFLNDQGNVQVLSSPRVATMNNQKAIIKIGTDQYYVTNVASNTSTASGASNTSADVTFTPFFSGIALDVTPFIDENDVVTLHVHPSITTVSSASTTVTMNGQSQIYPLAKSELRESDSVIRAQSGQIVVIGGLMQHQTSEAMASVPFLGDIPYFGSLFRQIKQVKTKNELVILLKPTVVNHQNTIDVLQQQRDAFAALDRPFHWGGLNAKFGDEAEIKGIP